ncbi:MAG: excalibur calcium-binding domain-containing protein [Cyanobium sp.]
MAGADQEAQQLLSQGHSYLDRDGDGEACEAD